MNKFLIVISLLLSGLAFGQIASDVGHGGDTKKIKKASLRQWIEKDLKRSLKTFVVLITKDDIQSIVSEELRMTVGDVVARGFESDLDSNYKIIDSSVTDERCLDKNGKPSAASAKLNDIKGDICFDLELLSLQSTSFAQLVGLGLHEHFHHFGYEDENHMLAKEVGEIFQTDFVENRTETVVLPNNFVCIDGEKTDFKFNFSAGILYRGRRAGVQYFGSMKIYNQGICSVAYKGRTILNRANAGKVSLPKKEHLNEPAVLGVSCMWLDYQESHYYAFDGADERRVIQKNVKGDHLVDIIYVSKNCLDYKAELIGF